MNLLSSYQTNPFHRVKINDQLSEKVGVEYGVPQDTVLGPILFLANINHFCKLEVDGPEVAFADDTVLLVTGPHWDEAREKAERVLNL